MRGCFQDQRKNEKRHQVLPAYAGMFPRILFAGVLMLSSPRVCGDVSYPDGFDPSCLEFSPRMRGCFESDHQIRYRGSVLPAYAGMFPRSCCLPIMATSSPRVCGDVSRSKSFAETRSWFSPRMRGCFQLITRLRDASNVLPAYAGMFLLRFITL